AASYDQDIDPRSLSAQTFAVYGMQTGRLLGPAEAFQVNSHTISLAPSMPFKPGELVQATATTGIQSILGRQPQTSFSWQFRTSVPDGTGFFDDSGQRLGGGFSFGATLGDVNGDGNLDAFVTYSGFPSQPSEVWFNDGSGHFTDSGQRLDI